MGTKSETAETAKGGASWFTVERQPEGRVSTARWNLKGLRRSMHRELRDGRYEPQPVLQRLIPKAGQPGKFRPLGIPTIYGRVCQQALLNRLEPIFEPVFDDTNCGYRRGRSAHGALRKIWSELDEGHEWVVDADLKDFSGPWKNRKL